MEVSAIPSQNSKAKKILAAFENPFEHGLDDFDIDIKWARNLLNVSQVALSRKLGISTRHLQKIEAGEKMSESLKRHICTLISSDKNVRSQCSMYDFPFKHVDDNYINMTDIPLEECNAWQGQGRVTKTGLEKNISEAYLYFEDLISHSRPAKKSALLSVPKNTAVRVLEYKNLDNGNYRYHILFGLWKIRETEVKARENEQITLDKISTAENIVSDIFGP